MTPEERQHRAGEANRLLNEPLLNEALDALEHEAIEAMLRTPRFGRLGDRKARHLADKVNVIRTLRDELKLAITLGQQSKRGPFQVA